MGDDYCSSAVVGVKAQRRGVLQAAVEKEDDMVVGVVDESEGADRAGFETEVTHHPFGRGEREFAGGFETMRDNDILEPMLDVMDCEIVVAREADEVVLVAFVVAHEDVFAMDGTIIVPPTFRLLDGLALGVIVGRERNVVFVQIAEDALLTVGNNLVVHIFRKKHKMP